MKEVFGMPVTTAVIIAGVPVVISALLAVWGVWYRPERYEGEGVHNSTGGRKK